MLNLFTQAFLCLGREDIKLVVDRLLYDDDKHLTRAETTGVIDNLLKEVDNDEDGAICFPEFQQAMQKVGQQILTQSQIICIYYTKFSYVYTIH